MNGEVKDEIKGRREAEDLRGEERERRKERVENRLSGDHEWIGRLKVRWKGEGRR